MQTVGIGHQNFEQVITKDIFYIDKTHFIKEWWESEDQVTLITRPRRFGKTLNMSMTEQFFSVKYENRGDLFEGLSIWEEEKYRKLQGTYPVIALSFADVKETTFSDVREKLCLILQNLYNQYDFLVEEGFLKEGEEEYFRSVTMGMSDTVASYALKSLSAFLERYYGKKVIILLDEYDTPLQEAYVNGYWKELVAFTRSMFNATFKTNPHLDRAIMTGITRVSKESIFSDLNNLEVVTTTSEKYAESFGFTQQEVFDALKKYGLSEEEKEVKRWYDGFTFGNRKNIYNPWSIINYLDKRVFRLYWANTSSNSLVGKLIQEGSIKLKEVMEDLLKGGCLCTEIDEQLVFSQLDQDESAVWSLLLASGYLKVERYVMHEEQGTQEYDLTLTNKEVKLMFERIVRGWFSRSASAYNDFIKALLLGDLEAMNEYINRVSEETFSFFDTGKRASGRAEPERFYHGFVLGLLVELKGRYSLTSNRESGFGRYDILLEPKRAEDDAIIIEFKVFRPAKEQNLEDTVRDALNQIRDKKYGALLEEKGIETQRIRAYGFAFSGKNVLIGGA